MKLRSDEELCTIFTTFNMIVFTIVINLIVALSADRYWAICHPISYFTIKDSGYKSKVILACIVLGMISGISPAMGHRNLLAENCYFVSILSYDCLIFSSFLLSASCSVIVVFYALIYKTLSDQVNDIKINNSYFSTITLF